MAPNPSQRKTTLSDRVSYVNVVWSTSVADKISIEVIVFNIGQSSRAATKRSVQSHAALNSIKNDQTIAQNQDCFLDVEAPAGMSFLETIKFCETIKLCTYRLRQDPNESEGKFFNNA